MDSDQTGTAVFARCSPLWPEIGVLVFRPVYFGNRRYIGWTYEERGRIIKEGLILLAAFLNIEAEAWKSILGDVEAAAWKSILSDYRCCGWEPETGRPNSSDCPIHGDKVIR